MRVPVPTWMEDVKNRVRALRQARRVARLQSANKRLADDIGFLDGQITSDCEQLLSWRAQLKHNEEQLQRQRHMLDQLTRA